ncbi:MAG: class I SAM-dependent RNA methyltransferase [Candidatus Aegiribacteria sp.]|nr:class I SAM-dependent RNA methyltransferase [Candidatus Aegiribacteria sp.]
MDDILTVVITALGNDVGGISSAEGRKTVFVRGALPGETVRCRISSEKKNRIKAELLEVVEASPHRITPFCEYFGKCGGCSLQHLSYSQQLIWKRNWIEKAFSRAKISFSTMEDVVPSPQTTGYRNRVSFDVVEDRPGLHRFKGNPFPVNECPLLNRRGRKEFRLLQKVNLGHCARVSVRASDRTGSAMLEFRGGSAPFSLAQDSSVITAWEVSGKWVTEPEGSEITEQVGGCTFPIRPGTFFQVNPGCADRLISTVSLLCEGDMNILDLYGGSGAFALPLAASGAKVVSVEINPDSSISGRKTAEMNGVDSASFITGPARQFITDSIKSGKSWDTVIVDPPRAGLGIRISRLLRKINSRKIIYVSCNPFSLARDLRIITERDWTVQKVQPIDMFPQTDHIETVVLLERKENICP